MNIHKDGILFTASLQREPLEGWGRQPAAREEAQLARPQRAQLQVLGEERWLTGKRLTAGCEGLAGAASGQKPLASTHSIGRHAGTGRSQEEVCRADSPEPELMPQGARQLMPKRHKVRQDRDTGSRAPTTDCGCLRSQ